MRLVGACCEPPTLDRADSDGDMWSGRPAAWSCRRRGREPQTRDSRHPSGSMRRGLGCSPMGQQHREWQCWRSGDRCRSVFASFGFEQCEQPHLWTIAMGSRGERRTRREEQRREQKRSEEKTRYEKRIPEKRIPEKRREYQRREQKRREERQIRRNMTTNVCGFLVGAPTFIGSCVAATIQT